MHIDETGRDDQALGIDFLVPAATHIADFGNAAILDQIGRAHV